MAHRQTQKQVKRPEAQVQVEEACIAPFLYPFLL